MGTVSKILGRIHPLAAASTALYVCPVSTESESTVTACNQSTTSSPIRIAVVPDLGAIANTDYLLYDYTLLGNSSISLDNVRLSAGDSIFCYAENATVSFVAMGTETS